MLSQINCKLGSSPATQVGDWGQVALVPMEYGSPLTGFPAGPEVVGNPKRFWPSTPRRMCVFGFFQSTVLARKVYYIDCWAITARGGPNDHGSDREIMLSPITLSEPVCLETACSKCYEPPPI